MGIIWKVDELLGVTVTLSSFSAKPGPQCFRCQRIYHNLAYCHLPPRCAIVHLKVGCHTTADEQLLWVTFIQLERLLSPQKMKQISRSDDKIVSAIMSITTPAHLKSNAPQSRTVPVSLLTADHLIFAQVGAQKEPKPGSTATLEALPAEAKKKRSRKGKTIQVSASVSGTVKAADESTEQAAPDAEPAPTKSLPTCQPLVWRSSSPGVVICLELLYARPSVRKWK